MTELRENRRRVFLAGGGTGGHLYPGLAVARALCAARPETAVAFSTTRKTIDRRILAETDYPATPIAAVPFRKAPWTWPRFLLSLAHTGLQVRRRFREFCPDVVVGLGGYGSYAPGRVGRKYGCATVLLNPDIVPGKANRVLGLSVDLVCCQFEETLEVFGDRARLTGCPIRPDLLDATRPEALEAYGLDPERKTLLVTGASSGARTVNRAVCAMLREGRLPDGWQMLHLAGPADHAHVEAVYGDARVPGTVLAYEHAMGRAYAAADLAIARAGASTVAELTACGVPAIFLPYPFHRDQHQMRQARAVEAQGAAVVVEDRPEAPQATWRDLAETVATLARHEVRRAEMRREARRRGRPDAAKAVAEAVLELADAACRRRHAALRGDVDKAPPASYTPQGEPHG